MSEGWFVGGFFKYTEEENVTALFSKTLTSNLEFPVLKMLIKND